MWCLGEERPGDRVIDGSWDWGCQWMEITSPGGPSLPRSPARASPLVKPHGSWRAQKLGWCGRHRSAPGAEDRAKKGREWSWGQVEAIRKGTQVPLLLFLECRALHWEIRDVKKNSWLWGPPLLCSVPEEEWTSVLPALQPPHIYLLM